MPICWQSIHYRTTHGTYKDQVKQHLNWKKKLMSRPCRRSQQTHGQLCQAKYLMANIQNSKYIASALLRLLPDLKRKKKVTCTMNGWNQSKWEDDLMKMWRDFEISHKERYCHLLRYNDLVHYQLTDQLNPSKCGYKKKIDNIIHLTWLGPVTPVNVSTLKVHHLLLYEVHVQRMSKRLVC